METKKCSQSNVAVLAYSCACVYTQESKPKESAGKPVRWSWSPGLVFFPVS